MRGKCRCTCKGYFLFFCFLSAEYGDRACSRRRERREAGGGVP